MFKYIIKRIIMVVPVVLGVMIIVFFFQSVSDDDPVAQILGAGAPIEAREAKREELGLNDPILVQFGRYVWRFVSSGSLGESYKSGQPVTAEIMKRFPMTIKLACLAVLIGSVIGIPLGVWSAVKQYSPIDTGIVAFSVFIESFPNFWLALMLITTFSVKLQWFPTSFIGTPNSWVLPIACVSVGSISMVTRVTRSSVLETIRQDFVRTARAKGQSEIKVILNHVLRNSMIPILAAIGNSIGSQLGGALIVETIFAVPGIGKYAVDAISARNYPSVLGSVVVLAITFTIVNLLFDLSYMFVDPKIKTSFVSKKKGAS